MDKSRWIRILRVSVDKWERSQTRVYMDGSTHKGSSVDRLEHSPLDKCGHVRTLRMSIKGWEHSDKSADR